MIDIPLPVGNVNTMLVDHVSLLVNVVAMLVDDLLHVCGPLLTMPDVSATGLSAQA